MKKICPKGKHWVEIRGIKNGGYCRKSRGRRHPFAEKLRQPLENGLKDPSGGLKEQLGSAGITGAVLGALGGAVATAMLLTPKGSETAFRNGQMEAANEFAKKETELRSQLAEEIGKAKQEYAAKGVDVEAVNQKLTAEQERMKQRAASLEQELAGLKAIEGTLAKATAEKSALSKELEEAKKALEAVMKAPAGGQTQGAVELSAKLPGLDQQVKDRDATIADLKQKLKKAEDELVARVPHIAIERKIETLKTIQSQAEADLATAEQAVSDATDNSSKTRAERRRDQARSMLNKRARELAEAQEALNAAQRIPELDEIRQQLNDANALLVQKENDLNASKEHEEELKRDLKYHQRRASLLKGVATGQKEILAQDEEYLKANRTEISNKNTEIIGLKQQLEDKDKQIAAHQQTGAINRTLLQEKNELSAQLATAQAELTQAQQKLQEAIDGRRTAETEAMVQSGVAKERISKEDEKVLRANLESIKQQNKTQEQKIQELQSQINAIQSIVDDISTFSGGKPDQPQQNWEKIKQQFQSLSEQLTELQGAKAQLEDGQATSANQEIQRLTAKINRLKTSYNAVLEKQQKDLNAEKINGIAAAVATAELRAAAAELRATEAENEALTAAMGYGAKRGAIVTHLSGDGSRKRYGGIQLTTSIARDYKLQERGLGGFQFDIKKATEALSNSLRSEVLTGSDLVRQYETHMATIVLSVKDGVIPSTEGYDRAIIATHQHFSRKQEFLARMAVIEEEYKTESLSAAAGFFASYNSAQSDKAKRDLINEANIQFRKLYADARENAEKAMTETLAFNSLSLEGWKSEDGESINEQGQTMIRSAPLAAMGASLLGVDPTNYVLGLTRSAPPKKKEVVVDPPKQGVLSRLTQRITGKSDTPLPVEAPPPPPVLTPPPVPPIALDDRVLDEYRRGIKAPKRNFEDLTIDDIITKTVQAPENFVREKIRKATHIDLRSYPADLSGNLLTRMSVEDPELPGNGYELIFEHERSKNAFGNRDGNILAGLFNGRFIIVESDLAEKIFKGTGDPNAPGLPDPSDPYDRRGQVKNRFNSVIKAVSLSQKQRYLDPEGTILVTDLQMRHLGMKGVSFDSYFSSFCRALTHV